MKNILLGGRWSGVAPTIYHRWSPLWVNTYLLNAFLGVRIGYFDNWDQVQIVLESFFIVQQLLFSLLPLILTFDFDMILGSFFTFLALMGYFWAQCGVPKLFWGPLM